MLAAAVEALARRADAGVLLRVVSEIFGAKLAAASRLRSGAFVVERIGSRLVFVLVLEACIAPSHQAIGDQRRDGLLGKLLQVRLAVISRICRHYRLIGRKGARLRDHRHE